MADNKGILYVFLGIVIFIVLMNYVPSFKEGFTSMVSGEEPEEEIKTGVTEGAVIGYASNGLKVLAGQKCLAHDGITVTESVKRMFSPTTAMTGEFHRHYLNGGDEGLNVDGSTQALTPYDEASFIASENSSTYYARKVDVILPCSATASFSQMKTDKAGKDIQDWYKLYQMETSGALNAKCFNDDDGLLNSGSGGTNNQTLGASEKINVRCSIQGTSDEAFSPFGGIYFTNIYNSTAYDNVKIKINTAGWTLKDDVNTPTFRSNANVTTGFTSDTFYVKKSAGGLLTGMIENELIDYTLEIDTDDTSANNPSLHGGEIYTYYDDEDWYRHTDYGDMRFGAETDQDADVGQTKTLMHIFSVE